ncbi:hypothetical protein GCM10022243_60930 [Saccharothrix violaceirubra]|uniref:Uncharacterized protein n=1 Tax=Saccharothrix violaceirubra TaxID=413306 RepID=A0A7W7TA76_9PSEU|nr:hypothetical protein [Saccharothrix violaceirubra]MBB4968070.1 hypothetical protein [Saccharothrix violaceirubra]
MTTVTALDVRRLFNVTQETRYRFNGRHGDDKIVMPYLMDHVAHVVHRIAVDAAEAACRSAPDPGPPCPVPEVDAWRAPSGVVAHRAVEVLGRLPDWPGFREFCRVDDRARSLLWEPARELAAGGSREVARAVRRRVLTDYTAFLADMYVLAVLRGYGLDVRVHPLADLVFEVDAWVGRLVLDLRGGRRRAEALLVHAMPPFFFGDLKITAHDRIGAVTVPDRAGLDRAVRRLRKVLYPS